MGARTYHPRGQAVDGYAVRQHPLYMTWAGMLSRCHNKKSASYANYGARGITVCPSWEHFANFAADMGLKPDPALTLERVENNEGYRPDNCIWATRTEQCLNRRMFANNKSGAAGVVTVSDRFEARFHYAGVRYHIGRFETVAEAESARSKFIDLFRKDRPAAIARASVATLWCTSTTGVRGVTLHLDGGFVARRTENGVRKYLGYFPTIEAASAAVRGAA